MIGVVVSGGGEDVVGGEGGALDEGGELLAGGVAVLPPLPPPHPASASMIPAHSRRISGVCSRPSWFFIMFAALEKSAPPAEHTSFTRTGRKYKQADFVGRFAGSRKKSV